MTFNIKFRNKGNNSEGVPFLFILSQKDVSMCKHFSCHSTDQSQKGKEKYILEFQERLSNNSQVYISTEF